MFIAIMPAFWLVCALVSLGSQRRLLDAALAATTATGIVAWFLPQVLSLAEALTSDNTKLSWLALTAFVLIPLWPRVRAGARALVEQLRAMLACPIVVNSDGAEPTPAQVRRAKMGEGLWRLSVAAFIGLTFAAAVLYPPTVWDSLAHHLPRVAQFIQNQTVAPFPTYYASMNSTYPYAAYVLTQLKLLAGSDVLLNLAQWFAYVMVSAFVYRITRLLGAPVAAARFSTLAALSAPALALQATTTQYDLIAALWATAAVYVALSVVVTTYGEGPSASVRQPLDVWALPRCGALVGLAAVTKVTALIVVAPFALWLAVTVFGTATSLGPTRRDRLNSVIRVYGTALLATALAVAIALPLGVANVRAGGDVLGTETPGNAHILVPDRSAGALWMNGVRNLSVVLSTPSATINGVVARASATVAGAFGVSADDPTDKETADAPYALPTSVFNPDMAAAPLTALLLIGGLIGAAFSRLVRRQIFPLVYAALSTAVLVATAALITWQPFVVRSLVPALAIMAPLAGVGVWGALGAIRTLREATPVRRALVTAAYAVLALSVAYGLAAVVFSATSPLLPRPSLGADASGGTAGDGAARPGWWNAPYGERGWRASAAFLAPAIDQVDTLGAQVASTHRALFTPLGTESNPTLEWPPVAELGGAAGVSVPAYPIVESLVANGFGVRYEGRFGPAAMPGLYAGFSGLPSLVVSFDPVGEPGTTVVNGTPVADRGEYALARTELVPELGIAVSVYTLAAE